MAIFAVVPPIYALICVRSCGSAGDEHFSNVSLFSATSNSEYFVVLAYARAMVWLWQ